MLGHKRGQCHSQSPETPSTTISRASADTDITQGLRSLHIQPLDRATEETPEVGEQKVKPKKGLERAETVASLCSEDQAALEELSKPGIMADVYEEEDLRARRAGIQRWLEAVPDSNRRRSGIGTKDSIPRAAVTQGIATLQVDVPPGGSRNLATSESLASTAKPLGRTSSMEERNEFLNTLAEKSKKPVASVFTIAMADIHELESNAKRLKFHARIIAPRFADGTTGDGWLVIGREGNSVDEIFEQVAEDVRRSHRGPSTVVNRVSSGAVGAVVAWLYLAFS